MANRFWVGGSAAWDGTAGTKWSTTSGGAGGSAVPTSADDVFFDGPSGAGTITVTGTQSCKSLTCTSFTGTLTGASTPVLQVATTALFVAGQQPLGALEIHMQGTGNLTCAGRLSANTIIFAITPGAVVTLQDNFAITSTFTQQGTLNANNKNVTCANFDGSSATAVTMGSGIWTLTGTDVIWRAGSGTFTMGTAVLTATDATAATKTFLDTTARAYSSSNFSLSSAGGIIAFDLSTGSFTLAADLTAPAISIVSGTFAPASHTLTLTGTGTIWQIAVGATFTPATSTIKLTDATSSDKTFNGGSFAYNNIWFSGAGTGAFIIKGSNTFNDLKIDTPPHTLKFEPGVTTVSTFTVSGSASAYMTLQSNAPGTPWDIVCTAAVSVTYVILSDSHAHGGAFTDTHGADAGGNFGWTFVSSYNVAAASDLYFDSGYVYSGSSTAIVEGLNWLIGESLGIVADGVDIGDAVVSSAGKLTLPNSKTGSVIAVGKRYTSYAETLRAPQTGNADGSSLGRKMRINDVAVDILNTPYLKAGSLTGTEQIPPNWRDYTAGEQRTGLFNVPIEDSHLNEGIVVFSTDKGYQAIVRAIQFGVESEP